MTTQLAHNLSFRDSCLPSRLERNSYRMDSLIAHTRFSRCHPPSRLTLGMEEKTTPYWLCYLTKRGGGLLATILPWFV
jgi:hypothetical protein